VGIHRLADYDGPNAICRAAGQQVTTRIKVPARRYSALRFVAMSGYGDGELPLTFIYSDGTREGGVLHVDDWFDDPGAALESKRGRPSPDSTPLLNGLDRLLEGKFADANDAAVFETTITVDPRKELVSFELGSLDQQEQEESTCTSVLAVTGVWTGDG
jgi:hypothetical protein